MGGCVIPIGLAGRRKVRSHHKVRTHPRGFVMKAGKFFVSLSLGVAACGTLWGNALAEEYPTRTIRMVVPQSPGSGGDIVGRLMAESMAAKLRQPVVVENRAGANGVVAATSLAKDKPD